MLEVSDRKLQAVFQLHFRFPIQFFHCLSYVGLALYWIIFRKRQIYNLRPRTG